MSTSDTKQSRDRHLRKTIAVYLALSALCILFDKLYALFGHGVTSDAMTLMFLYPLLGGALPFFLLRFVPNAGHIKGYRFFYNCINAGIALLIVASIQTGVFEIAGTSSPYTVLFVIAGWLMVILALAYYLPKLIRGNSKQHSPLVS